MRFLWELFTLTLKRQLLSRRTWILVLVLPLMTFVLTRLLPEQELAAPVQVGVCLPKEGGEAFWQRLQGRGTGVVTFVPADAATVEAMVATAQWDCGILLCEDFDEKLAELDCDELFTFLVSPASTAYPLVQEAASTAVIGQIAPRIARDYMHSAGITPMGEVVELDAQRQVLISLRTLSGSPLATGKLARSGLGSAIRSCVGLLLTVWALFSATDLGQWLGSDPVRRLRMPRPVWQLLAARGAGLLTPALLSGAVTACLLPDPLTAFAAMGAYLLALWAGAVLLARLPGLCAALPGMLPFVVVLALITSPVLFDPGSISPVLGAVSGALPLSLYLRGCAGEGAALGWLLLEAAVLLTLPLPTEYLRLKK